MANTPKVAAMEVYPVAGKDCMELNLSGAHAPYFTRNIVVLTGPCSISVLPGALTRPGSAASAPGRAVRHMHAASAETAALI